MPCDDNDLILLNRVSLPVSTISGPRLSQFGAACSRKLFPDFEQLSCSFCADPANKNAAYQTVDI